MKSYILIPFVLLAGLVIGGIGPRSELTRVRQELEEARKLASEGGRRTAAMSDVTNLLGIERADSAGAEVKAAPHGKNPEAAAGEAQAEPSEKPVTDAAGVEPAEQDEAGKEGESSSEDQQGRGFEQDLDRAIELWQTRVDIAKNTFVANTRIDDAQAMKFGTILDAMNIRIGTKIDQFAKEISQAETVQPEAGIRLVNDITESMVTAYDEMDQAMPNGWRSSAGSRFSMTDFIDPEVARPLVSVEGKLQDLVVH